MSMRPKQYVEWLSHSPKTTKQIGRKIGLLLRNGDVVALFGGLGTGKTTLVKGIAKGIGLKKESQLVSPTFVLIHEYKGRHKIFHMDWYRLESLKGFDRALAEECFNSQAITLIEWADRGKKTLPKEYLRIDLEHGGPRVRRIRLSAKGRTKNFLCLFHPKLIRYTIPKSEGGQSREE